MPSFAANVKSELAHIEEDNLCCYRAELAALLRMGATVAIGERYKLGLRFNTDSAAVARRTLSLLKKMGNSLDTDVTMERMTRFRRAAIYTLHIPPSEAVTPMLDKLGIIDEGTLRVGNDNSLLRKQCCKAAYLRGAFLGGGSVNRPEASYHLELVADNYQLGKFLHSLLKKLEFPAGLTDRKDTFIVYIKEGDAVIDFLTLIGAIDSAEQIAVARNIKEVRAQVNRIVNCETANMQKAVSAAQQQIRMIQRLRESDKWEYLTEELRETAELRLANPELSLRELATLCYVSKSGLNNRLAKLRKISEEEVV